MRCPLCTGFEVSVCFEKTDRKNGKRIYYQCGECALVFMDPAFHLSLPAEKAVYDLHRNGPENSGYVRFLKRLADPLSARLPQNACGIDFGCGPGPTLQGIMENRGFRVYNYDPYYFPETVLLERRYDFIACTEVIEHFCRPAKSFVLIDRLLKNSGVFGLMTQLLPQNTAYGEWWYLRDPTHVAVYSDNTFSWIGKRMGWRLEKQENGVVIYSK